MSRGLSLGFNFTGFHSCCKAAIFGGGGGIRAEEVEISETDDAIEAEVFERARRPDSAEWSGRGGSGTDSTISCPLLKAFDRKGLRSPSGTSEKSAGLRVLRASCRADITLPTYVVVGKKLYWNKLKGKVQ